MMNRRRALAAMLAPFVAPVAALAPPVARTPSIRQVVGKAFVDMMLHGETMILVRGLRPGKAQIGKTLIEVLPR